MDNNSQEINLKALFERTLKKKWRLLIIAVIAIVASSIIILPVPRYYTCSVELAPELGIPNGSGGSLADIASSMGININSGLVLDAISPELYPVLMKSNNFVVTLIDSRVKSADGIIDTTYYNYLLKHQKYSPWAKILWPVKKLFSQKKPANVGGSHKIDPFRLTKEEDNIFNVIKNKIRCSVDKKTDVITITVNDQDPLIAATMSETAMQQLQAFITEYRTGKARTDVEYYKKLTEKAKETYEKARRLYGSYADSNSDLMLESYRLKQEDLENDMQLKFNAYSTLKTQLQQAEAKLQERIPAFTVLKSASVPIKPAGPKRMMFVLGITFIALLISIIIYTRDIIF